MPCTVLMITTVKIPAGIIDKGTTYLYHPLYSPTTPDRPLLPQAISLQPFGNAHVSLFGALRPIKYTKIFFFLNQVFIFPTGFLYSAEANIWHKCSNAYFQQ